MPTEAELLSRLSQDYFLIEDRTITPPTDFDELYPAERQAITLLCEHYDYTCERDDIL